MAAGGVALVDAVYETKLGGGGRLHDERGGRGQPTVNPRPLRTPNAMRRWEAGGGRGGRAGQGGQGASMHACVWRLRVPEAVPR